MGFIWEMLHCSLSLLEEYMWILSRTKHVMTPLPSSLLPVNHNCWNICFSLCLRQWKRDSCFCGWDNVKRASKLYKRIILMILFHILLWIFNPDQHKGHVNDNSWISKSTNYIWQHTSVHYNMSHSCKHFILWSPISSSLRLNALKEIEK
jgi:hypothetical protein